MTLHEISVSIKVYQVKNKNKKELRVGSYILLATGLVLSVASGVVALALHRAEAKK